MAADGFGGTHTRQSPRIYHYATYRRLPGASTELFFRHFLILIITSPPVPIEDWRTMDGADVPI